MESKRAFADMAGLYVVLKAMQALIDVIEPDKTVLSDCGGRLALNEKVVVRKKVSL